MFPLILLALLGAGTAYTIYEHRHGRSVKDALVANWATLTHIQAATVEPDGAVATDHLNAAGDANAVAAVTTDQVIQGAKTKRQQQTAGVAAQLALATNELLAATHDLAVATDDATKQRAHATIAHAQASIAASKAQLAQLGHVGP